jgi:hypothetical protein
VSVPGNISIFFFPYEIWLLTTDRALQSARQELDRQRATDSLKKNLEKRPDKDELVERLFPFLFPFRSAFICHFLFSTFVL